MYSNLRQVNSIKMSAYYCCSFLTAYYFAFFAYKNQESGDLCIYISKIQNKSYCIFPNLWYK